MHQIGVGVFGPVFRTLDPDDGRLVAVKAFNLDITPEQAGSLATELNGIVQGGLSLPSLVAPLGAGLSDGVAYLAMQYVAAESLDVAIRRVASAAVDRALPVAVQLAEALDAAHARGVSHGALHLRDIFVTQELARVSGFGVVSALERVGLRGPLRRPYTAPEQIAGTEWGPAADRFALAAITFELLTGKRATANGGQVAEQLAGVAGVRDAVGLARFFGAALASHPAMRPASARLFVDELADAVEWPGADEVRQVLVRSGGEAGKPGVRSSDDAPGISVAGDSTRPSMGVESTGTEGAALPMAKKDKPESPSEPAFDWTERTLDHGESEEFREPEAYQPRPPGVTPKVARSLSVNQDGEPDFGRLDAELEDSLDDALVVDWEDESEQATLPGQLVADPGAPTVHAGQSSLSKAGASQPDNGDDTEMSASLESLRHGYVEPDGIDTDRDGDVEDEEVDLSVVQARYRQVDDSEESASDAPDTQAAGVYEAITLTDVRGRLGDTEEVSETDVDDEADLPDLGSERNARSDDANGSEDRSYGIESDRTDNDDYDPYGDDEDDLHAGIIASDAVSRARNVPLVPLALTAVVIMVAAFAVGFGWLAGDDGATGDPTAPDAVVAGGLADSPGLPDPDSDSDSDIDAARVPVETGPPPGQEFSEATVSGSPVTEAAPAASPVDALPIPPVPEAGAALPALPTESSVSGERRPEESETPEQPRAPAAPVIATEVSVASTDPEPSAPGSTGRLLVRSSLSGVRVAVNGEVRGTTPLALADLPFGVYDVRLSREGFETQERQLAISADDPIAAIGADLLAMRETRTASLGVGSLFVDTRPSGVEVWLDQRLVGDTPMLIPNVSAGAHEVEFRHEGYRDWATTVRVGPSMQARVTASLDHVP
jgi:serine/threonine protein kinase